MVLNILYDFRCIRGGTSKRLWSRFDPSLWVVDPLREAAARCSCDRRRAYTDDERTSTISRTTDSAGQPSRRNKRASTFKLQSLNSPLCVSERYSGQLRRGLSPYLGCMSRQQGIVDSYRTFHRFTTKMPSLITSDRHVNQESLGLWCWR
jgi:hypothetical protein